MTENRPAVDSIGGPVRNHGLSRTVLLWFLLLALLPMSLVASISYLQARASLTRAAENALIDAAQADINFVSNWFEYRFMDLRREAEDGSNTALLASLAEGLQQSGGDPAEYVKSFDWARSVDGVQDDLVRQARQFDHIYDLLLIDLEGNILFTVAREFDLGTNLFDGPYAGTRFGRAVRDSLETGRARFSDLERYAPSDNTIAGFLTAPLIDEFGAKVGVFAIQLKLDRVFRQMNAAGHGGSSQNHYLAGQDGLLRTAITDTNEEVLTRAVDTAPFLRWRQARGDGGPQPPQKLREKVSTYAGPDGQIVLGLLQSLPLPGGIDWALIGEIDRDDALAVPNWLGAVTLIIVILTGLLVSLLAILQARYIARPITQLVEASLAVASGEIDQKVEVSAKGEIGQLAQSFNHMLAARQKHEKAMERRNREIGEALSDLSEQKAALQESKGKLDLVLESTGAGVWDWQVQSGEADFDERWAATIGYTLEELAPLSIETWTAHLHPDDRKESAERLAQHWRGETDRYVFEPRMRHKQGHWVWMLDVGKVVERTPDGKPKRMIGTHLDITERKIAEEQIAKQKEYYETLIDNLNFPAFVIDIDHTVVTWNRACEILTGLRACEVIGTNEHWRGFYETERPCLADLLLDNGVEDVVKYYEKGSAHPFAAEGARAQNWCQLPTGKERYLDIDACPVLDQEGNIIAVIEVVTDITEEKRAAKALEESKAKLQLVIDSAAVGIWDWRMSGGDMNFNQRWAEIFGYKHEEMVLQDMDTWWKTNCHPDDLENVSALVEKHWAGETDLHSCEYRVRHKQGHWIWILDTGRTADGRPDSMIGTSIDITERKEAELALLEAKESAESATQAKSEFLANMSHEIRTPMNGILGMTQILLDTELNSEQRDYAETIHSSGDSLLGIINEILDFSKVEAGKLDLEPIPFDLPVAVMEVVELLQAKCTEKNVELIVDYAPDIPRRYIGDPGRLRQILMNLIGNSIKFTARGHVLVEIECLRQDEQAAELRFAVVDTGIGIAEDARAGLFDSFSQADATTTRKYGGTGLGLAICKQLVELMGGVLDVESTLGEGSTFWFTLRLPRSVEPQRKLPRHVDLDKLRILVVDDNPVNRAIFCAYLGSWKMRVESVSSGAHALECLHSGVADDDPFHIALIDYQMPEMDGEQLGAAIRSDKALCDTQLLLLSPSSQRGDAKRFSEAGFAAYLGKPVDPSTLMDILVTLEDKLKRHDTNMPLITRYTIEEARAAATRIEVAETDGNDQVLRVLLVEDNIVNQKVAKKLLENRRCTVDVAANGKEGVEMQRRFPYDIVFMDCQMPVMDGFEATAAIRKSEKDSTEHPVIIAMTANALEGDREKCLEKDMDDYVSKPVDKETLKTMLDEWRARIAAKTPFDQPSRLRDTS